MLRETNMANTNDTKEQQTRKSFAPGAADSRQWTTDTCQEKARKPIGPRQKGWFIMICLFAASTVISWHTILWAMHPFTCFFITGLIHWLMFFFVQYTTLDTHYYISVMRPFWIGVFVAIPIIFPILMVIMAIVHYVKYGSFVYD